MKIIDITQPLFECAVFPGDSGPTFTQVATIAANKCNLTNIALGVHNGTHIDAPCHFIENGGGVSEIPLDIFYGKCVVSDKLIPCERLLLKGDITLTADEAKQLVSWGVKLVGVESQSIGAMKSPMEIHLILLGAGIVPLEGIRLSDVACGEYLLSAFPLNLGKDCDGSPVRAVLIEM